MKKLWLQGAQQKEALPGEGRVVETSAVPTLGAPPRDQFAAKSVAVMEIKYSDGSVWRHK